MNDFYEQKANKYKYKYLKLKELEGGVYTEQKYKSMKNNFLRHHTNDCINNINNGISNRQFFYTPTYDDKSNGWKNTDEHGYTNVYDRIGNVWKTKLVSQTQIVYLLVNPTTDNIQHLNLYVIININGEAIEMFKLYLDERLLQHWDGIIPDISFDNGKKLTKNILNRITFEEALELISGEKQQIIHVQSPSVTKRSTAPAAPTVQAVSQSSMSSMSSMSPTYSQSNRQVTSIAQPSEAQTIRAQTMRAQPNIAQNGTSGIVQQGLRIMSPQPLGQAQGQQLMPSLTASHISPASEYVQAGYRQVGPVMPQMMLRPSMMLQQPSMMQQQQEVRSVMPQMMLQPLPAGYGSVNGQSGRVISDSVPPAGYRQHLGPNGTISYVQSRPQDRSIRSVKQLRETDFEDYLGGSRLSSTSSEDFSE